MTMLRCSHCKQERASSQFTNSQQQRGGSRWCRPCVAENNRRHNLVRPPRRMADMTPDQLEVRRQRDQGRDPAKSADRWFWYRYGLTLAEVDAMIEEQGGLCAICLQPETVTNVKTGKVRRLSVDHDHRTGLARRMLCMRCNRVLAEVDDDTELLARFIDYLTSVDRSRTASTPSTFDSRP